MDGHLIATTSAASWWLLRHAPTEGPAGQFAGRSDRPVAAVKAADLAPLVRGVGQVDLVVLTPLRRTAQTLGLLQDAGLVVARTLIEPDLVEQDFGDWEGCAYHDLAKTDPAYWPFWTDPVHRRPPQGESFAELSERSVAAWRRIGRDVRGARVLHVGHAGPIRALLGWAAGATAQAALERVVPPLSLHRLSPGDLGKPAAVAGDMVGADDGLEPRRG